MAQAYEEAREQMADSRMEMETQAEQSLQQEWGANYERNMGRATAALQRLASETGVDADALLDNPGLGSNPDVIRLLYQASRLLDEALFIIRGRNALSGRRSHAHGVGSLPSAL